MDCRKKKTTLDGRENKISFRLAPINKVRRANPLPRELTQKKKGDAKEKNREKLKKKTASRKKTIYGDPRCIRWRSKKASSSVGGEERLVKHVALKRGENRDKGPPNKTKEKKKKYALPLLKCHCERDIVGERIL